MAEAVERADGDDTACNRRGREHPPAVFVHERLEVPNVCVDGVVTDARRVVLTARTKEGGVAPEVAPVRGERVRGEPAFDGQPVVVLREQAGELVVRHRSSRGHKNRRMGRQP